MSWIGGLGIALATGAGLGLVWLVWRGGRAAADRDQLATDSAIQAKQLEAAAEPLPSRDDVLGGMRRGDF